MSEIESRDPAIKILPDQDFKRVLCVVAHPDDLEYGTSVAVSQWIEQGVEVAYLLLTSGEAGMQIPPEETGPLRAGEQRAACDAVGVTDLTILDHTDGVLMPTLELRRDIARKIRQFKPDVVVTMAWDVEVPWGLNQADHRAAGLSTLDAVRDADNTWVFPELATDEDLPKWGTRWFLVNGSATPNYAVVVSDEAVAKGVASLEAHKEYLAALPGHPAPADFIPAMTAEEGKRIGVPHAVLFRGWDFTGPPE